jgi:hypothetical protein
MFKKLVPAVASLMLVTSLLSPAAARPPQVKGSFTASAKPLPGTGCYDGVEGVHKVSHPVVAPFSGWLRVKMTFGGDWDLRLDDASGAYLAASGFQEDQGNPVERLHYYLDAGQEVVIVVCNYLSETDANVTYTLTSGKAWASDAGTKRVTRLEELSYTAPAIATPDVWGICHVGYELGCTATYPRSRDRFVSVEVLDDASPNVSFEVYQYSGSTYLGGQNFCGSTDGPIPVKPRATFLGVSVFLGPCQDGTPAMPTKGTVLMEFSNR